MAAPARVVIEADGGSRGNPGRAAYGAVLRDADTGEVIGQRAEVIGFATNNVAEYRGLIGGLELAAELAPEAEVEVRMDSKLVIEQMAGRWKIRHPDMKPLALRAQRLAPRAVRWTWVPRERNQTADALLNRVLDQAHVGRGAPGAAERPASAGGGAPGAAERPASAGGGAPGAAERPASAGLGASRPKKRDSHGSGDAGHGSGGAGRGSGGAGHGSSDAGDDSGGAPGAAAGAEPADPTALAAGQSMGKSAARPRVDWQGHGSGTPTTVLLLRHGITAHTQANLFCGSGGSDPGLLDEGRQQASRAAEWLARRGGVDAIVTSPLRRTRETAQVVADQLGLQAGVEDGLAEAAFGRWDGLSFTEVRDRFPAELDAWLQDTSVAPGGGESLESVWRRAVGVRDRLREEYAGRTVVAVSHVTPIKMLVRAALDAPMHVVFRMDLAPASLTTIQWWPDGTPALRALSYVPE